MLVSEQRHIHSWVLGVGWWSEPCIFRYIHPGPDRAMCQTERRKHRGSHFLHKQRLRAEMLRPCDKREWFTVVRRMDHLPSCGSGRSQISGERGTECWECREEMWTWVGQLKSSWRQWKVSWPLGAEWEIARWGGMGDGRAKGTFCREGGKSTESYRSFFSSCKWSRQSGRGLRCRWTGSRKQSVNSLWGWWKETASIIWAQLLPKEGNL